MEDALLTVGLARKFRRIAAELNDSVDCEDILSFLKSKYNLSVAGKPDVDCLRHLKDSISRLPPQLVKDCGIKTMGFKDMGESREYFPNHGVYYNGTLVLNSQILDDDLFEVDADAGNSLDKFDQTFFHELGHGWDEVRGSNGLELSKQPEWTDLSGWSEKPAPGLKKLVIREKDTPEMKGEWWYNPDAGYTRYYARRNPWDDWADSFSYYVGGLKSFLPEQKVKYFDDNVGDYFLA